MTRSTSTSASVTTKSSKSSRTPRSKYGNKLTVVDGITFHSRVEAARWKELKARAAEGRISNLERQVSYPIIWPGDTTPLCSYICDFKYEQDGKVVVEDTKGGRVSDSYRLKSKLMRACHGITVLEVFKRSVNGTSVWLVGEVKITRDGKWVVKKVREALATLPRIE